MITQGQFARAMQEINESYAKVIARVEELEKAIDELRSTKKPSQKKAA